MGLLILGPPGGPGAPGGTILLPRGLREPGVRYKKNVMLFKLQSRPRRGGVRKCDQNIIAPVTGSVEPQDLMICVLASTGSACDVQFRF